MSILLSTFGATINAEETFASTPMQEKQDIIQELEIIKNNSDINKKTKKSIESAITKIEKSLDEKFWKDGSSLNLKSGKRVLNADKNALDNLDKILKDKRESDLIKEDIFEINLRIAEVDESLIESAIDNLEDIIMSKKGLKKLDKAINSLEKGEEFLEEEKYQKAIKNFIKSWDQIKKSLKDPNFKKMKMVELEGTLDMNFDKIPDVYLKVVNSDKPNKPKEIQMKITGPCVNGEIHDDAAMKIGVSVPDPGPGLFPLVFFDEEIHATNKWFKKNDPNKKIDPVIISTVEEFFSFPVSGDDIIQKNPEDKKGSFDFTLEPIVEIGNQTGWIGKFTLDAEPGDYALHFWFPLTSPTNEGDSCNFMSSFSIPTTFSDKIVKQVVL
ncbi:MAG: hypothetical protein ACE5GR_08640 [Nitrosopumilus sp.]